MFAKLPPQFVVSDCDNHIAVSGFKDLKRRYRWMSSAQRTGDVAGGEIADHCVFQYCYLTIEHPNVNELSFAGLVTMSKCGEDPDSGEQRRRYIAN